MTPEQIKEDEDRKSLFPDEKTRLKYYPYPVTAITTSAGETYIPPEIFFQDEGVKAQIQEFRQLVREKGLLKKRKA